VVIQIVILAMIAAFLGMRLYSVLGRRAEHEEESIPTRFDSSNAANAPGAAPLGGTVVMPRPQELMGVLPAVEQGVREIASADRSFDIIAFLEGAKGAYGMVLEAFWNGDKATLRELCDDDVYQSFVGAITARETAGETLENRLIRIEDTVIHSAAMNGRIASVAVRFVADIATVTRDKDGVMIAGSLDDAVESRDIWTFSRDVSSATPEWVLDETDEG